jgi:hypothetical protein
VLALSPGPSCRRPGVTQMRTMTLVPHGLVGSLRGVQAIPEPCKSNSNCWHVHCVPTDVRHLPACASCRREECTQQQSSTKLSHS